MLIEDWLPVATVHFPSGCNYGSYTTLECDAFTKSGDAGTGWGDPSDQQTPPGETVPFNYMRQGAIQLVPDRASPNAEGCNHNQCTDVCRIAQP